MFQAGIDRKLVKEFTGHSSDAVDKYQITSHQQHEKLSEIIHGDRNVEHNTNVVSVDNQQKKDKHDNSIEISLKSNSDANCLACTCTSKNVNLHDTNGLGQLLKDMLEDRRYGKAKIKLEIDLSDS